VKNLQSGELQRINVDRSDSSVANGSSSSPQISADGRFVVFTSKASDLVENDNNHASDIFVRDRLLGLTFLASMNKAGTGSGIGASSNPLLARDGRTIVFQSFADDLAAGDYNNTRDIFSVRIGSTDSDGDGMDDEWEVAYFGNLARDGTGDFDGDGQTDLAEFLAGTDPTNTGSILRVVSLTSPAGGATTIYWSSVPGKSYRVQYKNEVDDANWTDLPGTVVASNTASSKEDPAPSGTHRFYRVITGQ
jgi:hypothetical protein